MLVDDNVLGFDIPVDDILSMAMVDRTEELRHIRGGFDLAKAYLRDHFVEKKLPIGQLHHQVDESCVIVRLIEVYNVGMVKMAE